MIERQRQGAKTVERRKLVISEDQFDPGLFKSGQEFGTGLDPGHLAAEMISFEELSNELCVERVILKQQNSQRRCHFFALPGGGSLMIAQNAPSSLTALTNSWKSTGLTT